MTNQDPNQVSEFAALWAAIGQLQNNPVLTDHFHNGFDASFVPWPNISGKQVYIFHTIYGTDAATAANYSTFFIAPIPVIVTDFREVHTVLGTDGSAVTLQLEKLTGTQAPGGGTALLKTALSLKATINTVQTATLTATKVNLALTTNNRLALLKSGTLTSVANVTVMLGLTIV